MSHQPDDVLLQVTPAEHATILAALRYYQGCGMSERWKRSVGINDIATNGETVVPLDDASIDELCERINRCS